MNSRLQKIKTYYNDSHTYLSQNYDIRFRAYLVKKISGDLTHANILDLGCGDGSLSLQFQSDTNKITLVDISGNMLNIARSNVSASYNNKNIRFINSSIEDYHTPERFDLVIACGIAAHVESIERMIQRIPQFMAISGRCIIQLTDADQPVSKLLFRYNDLLDLIFKRFTYRRNRISLATLIEISKRNSLYPVKRYRYSLMLPGMNTLLPNRLLYAYHELTYNNKFLNELSTDMIIEFKSKTTID